MTATLRNTSDQMLVDALQHAHPMALLGMLYHATGDEELRAIKIEATQGRFSSTLTVADPDQQRILREKAFDLLLRYRDGTATPPGSVSNECIQTAMSLALGESVPDSDFELYRDLLAIDAQPHGWKTPPSKKAPADFSVIVIGAGFQGLNAAIQLKKSGVPFVLLEKGAGPGGTWRQTKYPGARVDVASRFYSHSYGGPNYPFQHNYAPSDETEDYFNWLTDRHEVRNHMMFGVMVHAMSWDERAQKWTVLARDVHGGELEYTANIVISAIGFLERPKVPRIAGHNTFQGRVVHSSEFQQTPEQMAGKRIAIVGAGCTGAQMAPDIAPFVSEVIIFQRTPGWVVPVENYREKMPELEIWLNQNAPYYTNWTRFVLSAFLSDASLNKIIEIDPHWTDTDSPNEIIHTVRRRLTAYMEDKLKGRPDLIEICRPDHPPFGSRPIIDNGWFETLLRDNVTIVREGVSAFTNTSIVSESGREFEVDTIVLATGYDTRNYFSQIHIVGRGGVDIKDVWAKDGPRAYWGMLAPSMPNLFMLYGPNMNPRNLTPVQYGEWQMDYILHCVKQMIDNDWGAVEVKQQVYDRFNEILDEKLSLITYVKFHKSGYFVNETGRSTFLSPWTSVEFREAMYDFKIEDFIVTPTPSGIVAPNA